MDSKSVIVSMACHGESVSVSLACDNTIGDMNMASNDEAVNVSTACNYRNVIVSIASFMQCVGTCQTNCTRDTITTMLVTKQGTP